MIINPIYLFLNFLTIIFIHLFYMTYDLQIFYDFQRYITPNFALKEKNFHDCKPKLSLKSSATFNQMSIVYAPSRSFHLFIYWLI